MPHFHPIKDVLQERLAAKAQKSWASAQITRYSRAALTAAWRPVAAARKAAILATPMAEAPIDDVGSKLKKEEWV
jgi:hypothetical protein